MASPATLLLLPAACTVIITMMMASSVSPLSFNLSSIVTDDTNRRIQVQGDAYISSQGLQVTTDESSRLSSTGTGRATYVDPLHLWDNATGNLTDFETHFSFLIQSANSRACSADGLAFFLAPINSTIPFNSSGAGLGLAFRNATANVSGDPFVAVEIDTFPNEWDPFGVGPHVGIDINSLISNKTAAWRNNLTSGMITDAWISYNSISKLLLVTVTSFPANNTMRTVVTLNSTVDLRDYLPEWVSVGFSAATGDCFQKNNVKSWSFSSSLKDDPVPNNHPASPNSDKKKTMKSGVVIGLVVGLSALALVLILAGYWLRRKKRGDGKEEEEDDDESSSFDHMSMEMEFEKGSGPKRFSYKELDVATQNFAEEFKLGEGGFGGVYRGFLKDSDSYIAVKRVSKESKQGAKEYASEVKIISRLRHRNLVQLIGWCHEKREMLLVYEFLPNGSLDSHLFNNKSSLSWATRYEIARGLAAALLYLHEEWLQCVIHRDIKSSNVMLDSTFNAKLGDFGLARLIDHDKGSQTTILAGTMGYMAPECVITGTASKETDVYSFGIVALEIATGRKPIDVRATQASHVRSVEWVWELYGRGVHLEAADPKLSGDYDEREMERMMVVGLWCAHPDSTIRPSIRQAIQVLSFEAEPPLLPPKLPQPTYSSAPPPATITSLLSSSNATGFPYSYNSTTSNATTTSSSASSSSPSASLLFSR